MDDEPPKSQPLPPKGKGRGRARGRGRGRSGKVDDSDKGDKLGGDDTDNKGKQPKKHAKIPFLLTNLVRTGNQMGNAGSWKILLQNLKCLIGAKLKIEPLANLPDDADSRLASNRAILTMLGKLAPESDGADDVAACKVSGPSESMRDASEELLKFLGLKLASYRQTDSDRHIPSHTDKLHSYY